MSDMLRGEGPAPPPPRSRILTLRLLGNPHAQPPQVQAVLAADAGSAAAKRVERDGAHDQREVEAQLGRPGDINAHLAGTRTSPVRPRCRKRPGVPCWLLS